MTKFLCSAVSAATLALACNADSVLANSTNVTFKLDSTGPVYFVASQAEAASAPPMTWRKGETVTVTSPIGTVATLATDAASAGSAAVTFDRGGIWHFSNSVSGSAALCVPWTVFGDGGELASGSRSSVYIDTKREGPDRVFRGGAALPIAYSGDSWVGSVTAASTLSITPPEGVPVEEHLTGSGVYMVPEPANGTWRIALADGSTTRSATIRVAGAGFVISFQ